jgi:hypothetical protein
LPEVWLGFSVAASILAIAALWGFTQGAAGKWRMRFAVALFGMIAIGFASIIRAGEARQWSRLTDRIASLEQRLKYHMELAGPAAGEAIDVADARRELEAARTVLREYEATRK